MRDHKFFGSLVRIPFRRRERQMPRINSHRKIRAATLFVGGIYRRVQTLIKVRTDRCREMPAGRKPKHTNLVRIDVQVHRVQTHQPYRPLGIFQGDW